MYIFGMIINCRFCKLFRFNNWLFVLKYINLCYIIYFYNLLFNVIRSMIGI